MDNFNGNSFASKNANKNNKVNTPVAKASVKKSLGKKLFEEDAKSAGTHVFDNVVIPNIKKLISDSIKNAIDWLLYGSKGDFSKGNSVGYRNISYSSLYDNKNNQQVSQSSSRDSALGIDDINAIVVYDLSKAETVLLKMKEILNRYGLASVQDFYELVDCRCTFTCQKYGWRDLSTAKVVKSGDGWGFSFPKIVVIEN